MQVSLETTQGLERRMKVSIPAGRIETEVENRLKNLSRTVRLKGFRPGKVPLKVVESRYGSAVRQEVVDELTRSTFFEAIRREKLQLAGLPRIEPRVMEPGRDLEYEAVFEVLERIDIAPLTDVEIARPVAEITEEDVDRMIETLRRQRGTWRAVDRPAAEGDQVVIDFIGRIDGAEFPGNRGERMTVVIGGKNFVPGFEEGLIGMRPGETRTVDVRFPDDYHVAAVAGRLAQFEMTVRSVSEIELPEVDEAFIRSFDVPDGTMASMRAEVRKTMQEELDEVVRESIRRQAFDALYTRNPIQVSEAQVQAEAESLLQQARTAALNEGVSESNIHLERSMFEAQARRRVALTRLVAEIARRHNFVAEPERVRQRLDWISVGYENPEEVHKWYYADPARLANIEKLVIEDHVVDWVVSQARVIERRTDFQTLMREKQKG
jgi:trigger factor